MYTTTDCASVVNKRREQVGMTVRALARKTGIKEDALYGIICGKRKMTATELLSLSSVLNLTLDDYTVSSA